MSARELIIGKYDLSLLNELDQNFWRHFAEKGDLPELPQPGKIKIFWRKFETGVAGFPTMKARAVLTHEGKIVALCDWNSHIENGEIEV